MKKTGLQIILVFIVVSSFSQLVFQPVNKEFDFGVISDFKNKKAVINFVNKSSNPVCLDSLSIYPMTLVCDNSFSSIKEIEANKIIMPDDTLKVKITIENVTTRHFQENIHIRKNKEFLGFASVKGAYYKEGKYPIIHFDTTEYYFDTVYNNPGVLEGCFKFKNIGTDTLVIDWALGSGDIVGYFKEKTPPGEDGEINFKWIISGKYGRIRRSFRVKSNCFENPCKYVFVNCYIVPKN